MKRRNFWIGIVATLVIVAVAVTASLLWNEEQHLEEQRNEALEQLERDVGQYDEQSIVLKNTSKAKAKKLAELYNAELRITENGRFATLTLPEDTTIRDVYARNDSLKYIEDMSADYHLELSDLTETEESGERMPTRPQYSTTDEFYEKQTYLDYLNMGNVWDSRNGTGVTVAVIDSGIDTDHPEFAGRISEYSYNASEDKVVRDWLLEDGSYDWSLIEDEVGHGTAVTGVISAARNNGGMVGIAPNVELVMIKVECDSSGNILRTSDAVFGIYYAIELDVQVVNMSFGGYDKSAFEEVLQLAYDSDVICVASAGNGSTAALHYPSADKNVIGVGALDVDSWTLANYSNYGENLNLVAPGTTYTADLNGGYRERKGTSLAAPIVTAIIALYLQGSKYETFDQVTEVLYASCYDLGDAGKDWIYGYGAIDASLLIWGERGTVSFEMLTEEVDNQEKIFIRGHALQELPEPERLYAVFDGWYYDDTFTQRVSYYEDAFYENLTLYAKWVNEDDGVPYTYVILDDGTVEIRSYTGYRRYITIPDTIEGRTVSSIGFGAFQGQTRIREITLPSGLTTIKGYAFADCSNLIQMHIPAGVVTIGEYAFKDNVRFSSVNFAEGSGLKAVGEFAFMGCGSMESIELPATLRTIDGTAFYAASALHTIKVQLGGLYYGSRDGVLFNASGSELVAYPAAHGVKYTVPEITGVIKKYAFALADVYQVDLGSVARIEESAFWASSLTALYLPDTVTSIGEDAFAWNENMTQIHIGSGLTVISKNAFYQSGVQSVCIPQQVLQIGDSAFEKTDLYTLTFAEDSQLAWIGRGAFLSTNIQEVDIPTSVTQIGSQAFAETPLRRVGFAEDTRIESISIQTFSSCGLLETMELPQGLKSIEDMAFAGSGLRQITIPVGVVELGIGAFASCKNLTAVEVEEGNEYYHSIDGVVYTLDNAVIHTYPAGKTDATYTIHANTREVGAYAFNGTRYLQHAILPEGMSKIGEYAFASCGASRYTLPSTLKVIDRYAFQLNRNLTSITLPEGLEEIAPCAFEICALNKIAIPDSVRQIGRYAFKECWNLTTVKFNETSQIPRLGYGSFAYTGLVYFTVPANVSAMGQDVFLGCRNLRTVTFAKGSKLTSLSAYMFRGCPLLYGVYFEEGSALTSLQAHSLEGMTNITTIDLTNTKLTNIDNFAFRFCDNLDSIILPETVTNVGRYAFYACTSLSELTLPMPLEHIGSYAFLGTNNLELYLASENMPLYLDENWDRGIKGYYTGVSSVVTEGDYQYAILNSGNIAILEYLGNEATLDLNKLELGGNITIIGGGAFKDSTVTSVILPETLITIQSEAFQYTALQQIVIPAGVTFIGREAFAYTDIALLIFAENASISIIEQYAFKATENLRNVILPTSLTQIGTGVFQESGLTSVTFAEDIQLTEIPERAFAETQLTTVALPDSVILVNHSAFNHITTLKSVKFGSNDGIRLMSNAFYHTGLEGVHIPANVTYIGEFCFVALTELTEFTVDSKNPNYTAVDGLLMSKDMRELITVPAGRTGALTVPATVEVIGFGAFEESKLSKVDFHKDTNILTFGYRAFFKMHNLESITIPANVVSLDYYAFAYCENLRQVVFADGCKLKGIYEGAFLGCNSLSDITIPETIVEISDFAFYGCGALTKLPVTDAGNIKGIYDYAFAYTGISGELTFADTLNDIGNYAFLGTRLSKVVIPSGNEKNLMIGIGAFEDCIYMEEITLPFLGASYEDDRITWFGYIFGAGNVAANATYIPGSLKTVTVTEGITTVGEYCFYMLDMLEKINLPESISLIRHYAFEGTTAEYTLNGPVTTTVPGTNGKVLYIARKDHFGTGITGTLELSEDITSLADAFSCCSKLEKVVLPESITQIGSNTFEYCTSLTEIVIPDSIVSIGSYAFRQCESLTTIDIPDSVTQIGSYTFADCSSLPSITLPNTLTQIGSGAFQNCSAMETLTIPETVNSLGSYAFAGCTKLVEMILPENIIVLNAKLFSGCSNLEKVEMQGDVTTINDAVFADCKALKQIDIPETVTAIGGSVFKSCTGLREVVLPEALTSLGAWAFGGCTNLKSLNIPDGVTSLGIYIFEGCTSLESVRLSESLTEIPQYAFKDCSNLKTLHIPSSVTKIGEYVFQGAAALETITGAEGVTVIGKAAFSSCANLETYPMSDCLTSIGTHAFSYCKKLDGIVLPDTLMTLSDYAFTSCYALREITIPGSVAEVGRYAFESSGLTKLVISEGVQKIGDSAFRMTPIDNLVLPNSVISLGNDAFRDCGTMKTLHIGSGLTSVGSNALAYCGALENITVDEDNTALLGYGAVLYDTRSKQVVTRAYHYAGVVTIPDEITSIPDNMFSGYSKITDVVIHDGVTYVGQSAFANCTSLKKLVIPNTVKSFYWNALAGCTALETLIVGNGAAEAIPDKMFEGHVNLRTVSIGNGITAIGARAFYNCPNLTSVTIGNGVMAIKDYTFYNCGKLESVSVGTGITTLGISAFSGCGSLAEIKLGRTATSFGKEVFAYCSSLKEMPDLTGVTAIPSNAFAGCGALENVVIPDNVTSISSAAFYDCRGLQKVVIGNGVTTIGANAFAFSVNLSSVTLGSKVNTIGDNAFEGCQKLFEVYNNSSLVIAPGVYAGYGMVTYYAYVVVDKDGKATYKDKYTGFEYVATDDGFRFLKRSDGTYLLIAYCGQKETITLPQTIEAKQYTIYNFSGGVNVTIPDGVIIGDYAFNSNNGLKKVVIADGIREIGECAFYLCSGLEAISIGEGVTTIEMRAFDSCSSLKSITIPDSVTFVGDGAFQNCGNLETIVFGSGVARMGFHWTLESMFVYSYKLRQIIVSEDNPYFVAQDGVLYDKPVTKILYVPPCVSGEITVLDGVTAIGSVNFTKTPITGITLPGSVIAIDDNAFCDCKQLVRVIISEGTTTIGEDVFSSCKALTKISLPASLHTIGTRAFYYCTALESIVIPDGVLAIERNTFSSCKNLKSVTLPKNLKSLSGFALCESLETLVLPDGLVTIDIEAFKYCTALKELVIPDSVTEIGNSAFYSCTALSELKLPANLETIGGQAFYDCTALQDITLPAKLISIDGKAFYRCTGLTELAFPESVTTIGISAFEKCTELKKVTFTEGLKEILEKAFYGCANVTQVQLPGSVTAIGLNAFPGLTKVTFATENAQFSFVDGVLYDLNTMSIVYVSDELPETVTILDGVTEIGASAFANRTGLKKIVLSQSVKIIGNYAFSGCSSLAGVELADTIEQIGNYAFQNCTSLQSISIPDGLTAIGTGMLYGCSGLTQVKLPEDMMRIPDYLLYGCKKLTTIDLPDALTVIGAYALRNCSGLQSLTIPESVTEIGVQALRGCSSLKRLKIPDKVTELQAWTLEGTGIETLILGAGMTKYSTSENVPPLLKEFIVSEDNAVYSAQDGVLYSKAKTQIIYVPNAIEGYVNIPEGIRQINGEFYLRRTLGGISLPASVTYVEPTAFTYCYGLEAIHVAEDNLYYVSLDGVMYSKDYSQFLCIPYNISGQIRIPEGIVIIPDSAFSKKTNLTGVIFSNTVETIGVEAFYECKALKTVEFGSKIADVKEKAFYGCCVISELDFPDSVTNIGKNAFWCCCNLQYVSFGSSRISFGETVFEYASIAVLNLRDVAAWCTNVFANSRSTPLWCSNQIQINGEYAWNLVIPEGVTTINAYAFYSFHTALRVTLPSTLTSIGTNAFSGCGRLYEVVNNSGLSVRKGATDQGYVAFYAQSVKNSDGTATGAADFRWIVTEDGLCFIERDSGYTLVFYIGSEKTIALPSTINGSVYAISGLTGAVNVIVPKGITQVNFDHNAGLESVILAEDMANIGQFAFNGCSNLRYIQLPASLKGIGRSAFAGCSSLESMVIPEGVTSIDNYAFQSCSKLADISLPDSLRALGEGVFANDLLITEKHHGVSMVDGWIVDVAEDVKYIDVRGVRGAALDAYDGCYMLKNAVWGGYGSLDDVSNIETLIITHLDGNYFPRKLTLKNVVLMDSVAVAELRSNSRAFANLSDVRIFVLAEEVDLRWDDNFPGWSNDNLVYYAGEWTWVNFLLNDGQPILVEPRTNAQIIRLPMYPMEPAEQSTYWIAGWDMNGDNKPDSIPATAVVDLCATAVVMSAPRYYAVCFVDSVSGKEYNVQVLPFGETVTLPQIPEKEGYTFVEWTGYTEGMTVSEDVVIYAQWNHVGDGHTYGEPAWVDANCTQPGHYLHTCTSCGESYMSDTTKLLGHDYEVNIVASKCTEEGYTLYTCSRCSDHYTDNITDAKGHAFGDWITDVAADCLKEGTQHRVCVDCGETETKILEKTTHNYVVYSQNLSSCTENGTVVYCCKVCDERIAETLPLAAHSYGRQIVTKNLWERLVDLFKYLLWGETGEPYVICCRECGHLLTADEAQNGQLGVESVSCLHLNAHWEIAIKATCKTNEVRACICDECGQNLEGRIGTTADHSLVYSNNGDGTHTQVCETCGQIEGDKETHAFKQGLCVCGEEYPALKGDIDLDGDVDASDLTVLARHVGGIELITDATALDNADVDGDGDVDAYDLTKHARYVGGIITDWSQE